MASFSEQRVLGQQGNQGFALPWVFPGRRGRGQVLYGPELFGHVGAERRTSFTRPALSGDNGPGDANCFGFPVAAQRGLQVSGEALRSAEDDDGVALGRHILQGLERTFVAQVHQRLVVHGQDDVTDLDQPTFLCRPTPDEVRDDDGWLAHTLFDQKAQPTDLSFEEAH